MEPPAEAEADPPRSTPKNGSFFCIMCQKLFAEGKVEFNFYHYATWTALIESAASGCILCSQMMSVLLEDRQEELLPRLKEDSDLNDAKIYCRIDRYRSRCPCVWRLRAYGHTATGLLSSSFAIPWAEFHVYETSEFRKLYTVPSLMDNPIEMTQWTDNEKTWQNISRWLSDCSSSHDSCNSNSNEALWMPSRVIDVLPGQTSDVKEDRVCLVSTKDLSPLCKYATLSHCWGGQVPVQLRKETRIQLNSGYPVDSLPRTFADAVRITRRLGIRYVWIDSLCIEQDSKEDWRKESQTMDQVYSHSWCNIAASASKNSSVGCFFNWNTRFAQPFEADPLWTNGSDGQRSLVPHIFLRQGMWCTYVYDDVLDQRAWVMQERILPVRQLSFTRAGVFWECRCLLANPYLPEELSTADERHFYKSFSWRLDEIATKLPPRSSFDRDREIPPTYQVWNSILQAYSKARLTKPTDRLVAISGLAKNMRSALDDEYFAGLWKKEFLTQLCWMVEPDSDKVFHDLRRPRPLLAPTWSWASTLQPIKIRDTNGTTSPVSEVLEVNLQHLTDDPTGEVSGGYLRLRTILDPVDLSQEGNLPEKFFHFNALMLAAAGVLDETFTEQETCGNIFCIPLYLDRSNGSIQGLLLRPTCGGQSEYERIGCWGSIKVIGFLTRDDSEIAESWINELRGLSENKSASRYQDIAIY